MGGPGNEGDVLKLVTPIGDIRWDVIVFTVVAERFFVEGLQNNLYLFLKEFSVGLLIYKR
jgi:hypothetical protein